MTREIQRGDFVFYQGYVWEVLKVWWEGSVRSAILARRVGEEAVLGEASVSDLSLDLPNKSGDEVSMDDEIDEDWGEKHADWAAVKAQNAAWARDSVVMVRKIDAWVALAMSALQRTWHNEFEYVSIPGTPISRYSVYGVTDVEVREALIQHALWCMYLGAPLPEIKKSAPTP